MIVRLLYGAGGGLFGLIFGLLVLWGGLSLFRVAGAWAEAEPAAAPAGGSLVAIKESLEEGATGRLVENVDIVPSNVYRLVTKLLRVTRSSAATARFFAYPATQELLARPAIISFLTDPAVAGAASEGNYLSLLTNPKLAGIASDAGVQEALKSFELEKALDYALQESAPSPVPTP